MNGSFSALEDFARKAMVSEEMPAMYAAIAQENLRLAHQNMLFRAMQDHARLAHENMVLRMQSKALAPPGLQLQGPLAWPQPSSVWPSVQDGYAGAVPKPSRIQGHNSLHVGSLGRGGFPSTSFEASTVAGSSLPDSLDTSRAPSDVDSPDGLRENCQSPESRTSVMMRNLPNNYGRQMLLDLLETEGYGGSFDFLYLPVDFQSNSGLGYAFINFASSAVAEHFCQHFTGFNRWCMDSDKVCQVTWSDSLQGLTAHIERYRNSPVMHESVPEDHRPLVFTGSERLPFPPPTKKIRAPRRWHRRH